jgi:hypothetical protein
MAKEASLVLNRLLFLESFDRGAQRRRPRETTSQNQDVGLRY